MKKQLSILLTVMLIIGITAGCNSKTKVKNSVTSSSSENAASSEQSSDASLSDSSVSESEADVISMISDNNTTNSIVKINTNPLDKGEIQYTFPKLATYKNNLELANQWGSGKYTGTKGQYGIGDPFVLRFNGKYYLYPSSSDSSAGAPGVRVWQSDDLIHWEYKGYALSDPTGETAYAPEVTYYDGSFYMTQSQGGNGHRIYKSSSPLGPFKRITDNFGRSIDGSFYVGDNDDLLFFYPSNNVINVATIDKNTMLPGIEKKLNGTLNGWTEGPGMFRRGDYFYLTYTGNNVISDGYRIAYSYLKGNDPTGSFTMPDNNITILKTGMGNNFRGLGHSSNTIGPDLDSIYTAYHNLINTAGPQRRLMIDRYGTNGGYLYANGPTFYNATVPVRPVFEASSVSGFSSASASGAQAMLSKASSGSYFTAEFNFNLKSAGNGAVKMIFGYKDANNYSYAEINTSTKKLSLVNVKGGKSKVLGTSGIVSSNSFTAISTIRIENGYSTTNVYYNTMRKISVANPGIAGGKIGYAASGVSPVYGYTAFSNDVFGTSDFEAIKNVPTKFSAVHYLKGENRGFKIANATVKKDGIRQGEKENTSFDSTDSQYSLILDKSGDWVKYPLNVSETSYYGLSANINASCAGAEFQVIVDSKEVYKFTVPEAGDITGQYANLKIAEFKLNSGYHTMKIRLVTGNLDIKTFELFKSNPSKLSYTNNLAQIIDKGWNYIGNWKFKNNSMMSNPGDTVFAFTGSSKITNYSVQVDVSLGESDSVYDGGIIVRCNNPSIANGQVAESYQGYYVSIRSDQVTLQKYNYGSTAIDLVNVAFKKNEWHTLKVDAINNCIRVYVDDLTTPAITYYDTDAFLYGQAGLCSNMINIAYKNFKFNTITK